MAHWILTIGLGDLVVALLAVLFMRGSDERRDVRQHDLKRRPLEF
jgi:hypothetical protein